jgi:hypothetical protein
MEFEWGRFPPSFTDPTALKRAYEDIRRCVMDTITTYKERLERQKQVV